jgi:hypothetical protein
MANEVTIVVEIPESQNVYIPDEIPLHEVFQPDIPSARGLHKENEYKYNDIRFARNDSIMNDIIILLDKSGSMMMLGEEPIQAVKSFIQTQYDKAMAEPNPEIKKKLLNVRIRVILFNNAFDIIVDAKVLELDQLPLTYEPYGMTDLYSPIYDTFMEHKNSPKDIVIVSDGQNNTGPHNASFVKRQIKRAMEAGWTIRFVGCTIDSMIESNKLGLQRFTSDCSQDCSQSLSQVMRSHSDHLSQMNRERTIKSV